MTVAPTGGTERRLVVVGDGDVGAAVAHRLARVVGSRVLVLDAAAPVDPGGPATLARADLAHPDDARTALAPAAYAAWRDLERVGGLPLLTATGGLVIAGSDRREVARHTAVADRHGLDFTVLDALGLARRWPQLRPGPDDRAFLQRDAGVLDTTRAAAAHRALARGHGAELRSAAPVRALRPTPGHVEVVLDTEVVRADHVVVAAGTGTREVLADLADLADLAAPALAGHPWQTARHPTPQLLELATTRLPALRWHTDPPPGGEGPATFDVVGVHTDTTVRVTGHGSGADPAVRQAFVDAHLPGLAGSSPLGPACAEPATAVTAVTALPDGAMTCGPLPGDPRIGIAVGTGRHPMFAAVLGRALADLALRGCTRVPVAPFAVRGAGRRGDAGAPLRTAEGSR